MLEVAQALVRREILPGTEGEDEVIGARISAFLQRIGVDPPEPLVLGRRADGVLELGQLHVVTSRRRTSPPVWSPK